ncbi:MAG: DUF4956 domain-containing protein [Chloroflexota bacterium]
MFGEIHDFIIGAAFNLATALLIVRGIYYPVTRDRKYVPSFLAFNAMIFFVLSLLGNVELSVGVGFGLFAIFSVLNYRTDEMPIREMTYLFVLIALPVMNAFMMTPSNLVPAIVANAVIVVLLYVLEKGWGFRFEASHRLTYDRLDLIAPEKRPLLLADLRERTGLAVKRVDLGRIDFLRDSVEMTVTCDEPDRGRAAAASAPITAANANGAARFGAGS